MDPAATEAEDETLSKTIIEATEVAAKVLQRWDAMKPIASEVTELVADYSVAIDTIGSIFGVIDFVWDIYSNLEKAKENAAQQQAMVHQITTASKIYLLNGKD